MKYINTETLEYPFTESQIRKLNPQVSFPKPFKATPYAVVFTVPKPVTTVIQRAVETTPVLTVKGTWEQAWEVVGAFTEYTDEEDVVHTVVEQETEALAKDAATKKQNALDALASLRYEKETAGIVFNTLPVPTDRSSQAMLTGAYNTMQQNPARVINWKTDSGFVQLNKDAIDTLSLAVANHIQDCFDREMELAAAIELDPETDITEGWPV